MKVCKLVFIISAFYMLAPYPVTAGGCTYFAYTYSRQPDISCSGISCIDTFYLNPGDSFTFNLYWSGDQMCPTFALFYLNGNTINASPSSLTITTGGHYKGEVGYMSSHHKEFFVVYNSTTGMNNHSVPDDDIHLFPNPATNDIHIELPFLQSRFEKIKVFNSFSQIVSEELVPPSNRLTIKTEKWVAGLYYICIYTDENKFVTKRFLKTSY